VRFAAPGLLGGGPVARAKCLDNPGTPSAREIGSKETNVSLAMGDLVRFDLQGGGGYGMPSERDAAAERRDAVAQEITSPGAG
jgi:N-methylhydantoinase B